MGVGHALDLEEDLVLISLDDLNTRYHLRTQVTGVLHVGAHTGEEADSYDKLGFAPVFWVEADPAVVPALYTHVGHRSGHEVINAIVADSVRSVTLNVANNEQSSSILPLGTHAQEHPEVTYVSTITNRSTTVDEMLLDSLIDQVNFVNLDVQGAELLVLQGAQQYLHGVDFIYVEVNDKPLYEGCALLPEMDIFLAGFSFQRRETLITRHGWGDAFYVKGR